MQYSQSRFLLTGLLKVADLVTLIGVWQVSWFFRFRLGIFPLDRGIPSKDVYDSLSFPLALIFCAVFHLVGVYQASRIEFGFRAVKKIFEGVILGTLVLVAYLYFTELYRFSRIYLVIFAAVGFLSLVGVRALIQWVWNQLGKRLIEPSRVLLVGCGELLHFYYQQVRKINPYPVGWIGRLGPSSTKTELPEIPYLGEENEILKTVRNHSIEKVVVSYPSQDPSRYESILQSLSHELVTIKVIPDFGKFSTFTYQAGQDLGIPVLDFNSPPIGATDRAIKRLFDIFGSVLFMILFSPIYILIAILVKRSSPGPVIYRQKRMGAEGEIFYMYKFRTMPLNAEEKTGAVWAIENDERVTPFGRFLRKTSLDETPQFFNVLKGEMSLVGPRPERPVFVEQFRDQVPKYMLRHKVRSGITGWAQVNGWRGNTSIEERINHDLFYIRNWSLLLDIKILIITLFRGFIHPNAY